MTKLVLLIVFGLVVAYFIPSSHRVMVDTAKPAWVSVQKWHTKREMRHVADDLVRAENETGEVPDLQRWRNWLDDRYSVADSWHDPWGSAFGLQVWKDSIGIVSYGPDRQPHTADDFMVVEQRYGQDMTR